MELSEIDPGPDWAPQACTLPAAERPLRAAQFDGLFTEAVRGTERLGPTSLRLELQASPRVAAQAAGLAAAETGCCSFFTFTLTIASNRLVLDVTVPAMHGDVLDALADRATAATGTGTGTGILA